MPRSISSGDLAALHAVLAFPMTAFIPFLLLKCHKADASDPFHDNSVTILTFFIATITYVAAMVTELKLRIHDIKCLKVISNISNLSAPIASVSLVMIPFPRLGWFLFVIWIGFFVKLAIDSYQERSCSYWALQLDGHISYFGIDIYDARRPIKKSSIISHLLQLVLLITLSFAIQLLTIDRKHITRNSKHKKAQ